MGAMTFGGQEHPVYSKLGMLDQAAADRLVGTALDAGINFIDTADVYADGESEEILGRAIRARRKDVVLATKFMAPLGADAGPNSRGASRLHVMNALEDSLRRLGTDHIDVYYLHNHDHLTPIEETLGALDDAVRQGKIRYAACSNFTAWQVTKALGVSEREHAARFVANQIHYSLLGRDAERDLIPMAESEGVGLTIWAPLVGGFLTGKFDRGGITDTASRRAQAGGDFVPFDEERGFDVLDVVRAVAKRHDASPSQVAIAWLLAQRTVTSVIVGARKVEQLTDNLGASDLTLTAEDLAELDAVSALPPAYPNWIQAGAEGLRYPS
nr:aldo/keto reductase [Kribbella sandramycini]